MVTSPQGDCYADTQSSPGSCFVSASLRQMRERRDPVLRRGGAVVIASLTNPSDWRFPMACPSCEAVAGVPVSALTSVAPRILQVRVRCTVCFHNWQVEANDPEIVLKVQPDRRKTPRV